MRGRIVTITVAAAVAAAMIVAAMTGGPGVRGGTDMGGKKPNEDGAASCGSCGSGDKNLTPEQRRVMRCGGTEAPFTGKYWDSHEPGLYRCAACGRELFKSSAKYDSGSGWPSFFEPVERGSVSEKIDTSLGMTRTEIVCAGCGAHLGHVFDDGPKPTGRRYCVNSISLDFEHAEDSSVSKDNDDAAPEPRKTERAMFAAGCFWGVEAAFRKLDGVVETAVGYSGGTKPDPTYEEVCTNTTGHAEVVLVAYDPNQVSFRELLDVFWKIHDPTQVNRQGPDVGTQYRSAVFYLSEDQRREAEASRDALAGSGDFKEPIATEITEAKPFYRAEEYHQRYFDKHGDQGCAIR